MSGAVYIQISHQNDVANSRGKKKCVHISPVRALCSLHSSISVSCMVCLSIITKVVCKVNRQRVSPALQNEEKNQQI